MRRYHLRAKRMMVYIKTQDFKGRGAETDFSRGIINPLEAFQYAEGMLRKVYQQEIFYRSTGVVLTNLEEDQGVQFELFEDPAKMLKMRSLAQGIDSITTEYGKHTVC